MLDLRLVDYMRTAFRARRCPSCKIARENILNWPTHTERAARDKLCGFPSPPPPAHVLRIDFEVR